MGDYASRDLVRKVLSPLIAVTSSPDLDALCVENSIPSFLDLIRPFGWEIEGKVTIRDNKGQPKSHTGTSVRFADLKKIEPVSLYSEDALLSRNISDRIKNQARSLDSLKARILDRITKVDKEEKLLEEFSGEEIIAPVKSINKFSELVAGDLDELTPWFTIYRDTFFSQIRLTEHETFDHPVACVVATSTNDSQPLDTLAQLYEKNSRLKQLQYVNPDIFQYYVLVHDVRSGNMESTIALFEKIKKTLGINCQLLLINSRPPKTEGQANSIVPDVWGHIKDVSQPGKFERRESLVSDLTLFSKKGGSPFQSQSPRDCGGQLSLEDFEGLKNLVKKMFSESVLPYMERCMHLWNEQVASSRRGFTGRLFSAGKRYFSSSRAQIMPGGSGGLSATSSGTSLNSNSTSSTGSVYSHMTPEAQLRKLADYAFMLRDYDFAKTTYETVKKDFQADGAWRFYAGAQGSGAKLDVERYYDKAIRYYHANKMMTWAARSVLLYHAMLKHHGRYGDIPPLLARLTSEESDLRSALLLEQAAHGFLRISRVRKFGFHLILAGHRYNKCNQREHAYYCYQLASKVFGVAPAAQASAQDAWLTTRPPKRWGLMEDHISFSLGRQSFHLGELSQAIAHFTWLLHDPQQPTAVQAGYMKEFMYIYKNYIASTGHEILLEPATSLPVPVLKDVIIHVPSANTSWEGDAYPVNDSSLMWVQLAEGLPIPPSGIMSRAEPVLQICPLKESFRLAVEVYNPLAVPLSLGAMSIDYAYEDSGTIQVDAAADLVLEANQTSILNFVVSPQSEGILSLNGLTFMVNEHARTYKSFSRRGPRLNATPQQRQSCTYGPNLQCTLRVVGALPKVALQLDGLPESIFSGEVVSGRLQLRNTGASPLTHLSVSLTHPTYLAFGSKTPPQTNQTGSVTIDNNIRDCSSYDVDFYPASEPCHSSTPPLVSLDPGQTGQVPLHIRGDRVGTHQIYLLFRYEAADSDCSKAQYRVAKLLIKLEVLPSLKINAFTRPSVKSLGQFIVGIEVENVQSSLPFKITQLSSLSHRWTVLPITSQPRLTLDPGSSTSIYFTVSPAIDEAPGPVDWHSTEAHFAAALQNLTRGANVSTNYPPLSLNYTNIPFSDKPQGIWDHPCRQLYLASRTQNRTNWLAKDMSVLTPAKAKSSFPLANPSDIDLALYWEVVTKDGKVRGGHHFIIGITFNLAQNPLLDCIPPTLTNLQEDSKLTRSLFEGTAQEKINLIRHLINYPRFSNESPVRAIVQTPDAVHADFTGGSVEIPVLFTLKNFSWNRSAAVTLALLPILTDPTTQVCTSNLGFWWDGSNHYHIPSLSPGSQHTIPSKMVVAEPGTYDLSRWQLKVTSHTIPPEHEQTYRAYRDYLAAALAQPNIQSPTIDHIVSPPLPHLIHIYRNDAT